MAKNILWLSLVALVSFLVGGWISTLQRPATMPEREISGYILDEPRALPVFSMTDAAGQPFAPEDFRGDWSFIYFGYTFCPDVCPAALAVMAQAKQELERQGASLPDRYYLVSVDPLRDTPDRLAEYVNYFDPGFRGLTGNKEDIDRFTLAAGVVYEVPEDTSDPDYLVGHSSSITLIDPQGRIHAIFTSPHSAEELVRDMAIIAARYDAGP